MRRDPFEDLEHQLRRRVAESRSPRRRWWRRGWPVLSVVLVAAGTSAAVARVAEVGPFAYMSGGIRGENPKLAPASTITVQPGGTEPAWQARAYLNGLNQLCITGGPRDPRTTPGTSPGRGGRPRGAPQNGVTCTDSLGAAEALVDDDRPGATFATASDLNGALQGRRGRMDQKTGRFVPDRSDPATKMLVYGVRAAGAPRPVVRWYSPQGTGEPTQMQASEQKLVMNVDKSPDGLSAAEQRIVAGYPDRLELVLWAAEVDVPPGAEFPQVSLADVLPPRGVDDATIEMIGSDDMTRLIEDAEHSGWKYQRGITRDPPPVRRINAAQRKWIAAFGRPRADADEVPQRLRTEMAAGMRFGYTQSRKLRVVGGGLGDVWIAPGGMTEDVRAESRTDQICFLGTPLLQQCKFHQRGWKRPFAEVVSCTQPGMGWPKPLADNRTLVWALAPPGVTGVELRGPGNRVEQLPAGELLAARRPADEEISAIVWTTGDGKRTRVKVPWPKRRPRCERGAPGGQVIRKDNAGSYEESAGRPPETP